MKILQYIDVFNFEAGGPVRAVLDLCKSFADRGHDVTLISRDDTDVPDEWRTRFGNGHPLYQRLDPRERMFGRLSVRALDQASTLLDNADILHMHGAWDRSNVQLAALARTKNVPYVVSLRGMLDDWCMTQRGLKKRLYLMLAGKRVFEGAGRVHVTAQAELDQSKKWFPKGTGMVVPNLLDLAQYSELGGPDEAREQWSVLNTGRPVLLFLSRIHAKKGLEHLIDAMPMLSSIEPSPVLMIAGTGDETYTNTLKARVVSLGVGDDVHFVGHVGGTCKLSLYQASDLFVLPTSQENFGFVYFESLACETPIVTTRGTDTWLDLECSGAAKITHPLTPDALADDITQMLADTDTLEDMGKKGRDWVFDFLDQDRVLDQFEQMYVAAGVSQQS